MIATLITAAALLEPGAPVAPGHAFIPVPAADAIAYFRQVCVETMPSPNRFAARLGADRSGWTPYERRGRRGARVIGHAWRSSRGELSYLHLPGLALREVNPGCHYAFRTAPGFGHDETALLLAQALGLDAGRQTGNRRAPQTRWEGRLAGGLRVRVFLSSAIEGMDGPAARLSISAYVAQLQAD